MQMEQERVWSGKSRGTWMSNKNANHNRMMLAEIQFKL